MSEHREGTLFYDTETGRYDIRFDLESFYGGLHCGECFDVKVKDIWIPVRIEMGDDWYLVGLNVSRLDGLRVDIPYIEWSCIYGKAIYLEESKGGDLYKRVNGTFPKISTQSLRIIKLLHRKQGKIFTKSNEYYVRKISCAWGMPGFRIHSFQDYRRKIEMGITVGVQVPRIIPL